MLNIRRIIISCLASAMLLSVVGTWLFAAAPKKTSEAVIDAEQVRVEEKNGETLTTYKNAVITHEDATFSADLIEQRTKEKSQHEFTGTGNPLFKDKTNTIVAQVIIARTSPRSAEFNGAVRSESLPRSSDTGSTLQSQKIIITSDKLLYDYAGKRADFSAKDVVFTQLIPLENTTTGDGTFSTQLRKETTEITSKTLLYDFENKKALATGDQQQQVIVKQPKRTIWADQAVYDESIDLVVLTGNIRMRNSGEEEVKALDNAEKVTVSLANNWMEILSKSKDARVRITIEVEEDE